MRTGRPTKYKKKYARMAEVACREGGFTDLKLARLFDVTKSTINLWKKDHIEFSDSLKKGKDDWDSAKVETSLLKRATGYKFTETTKKSFAVKDEDAVITGYELRTTKIVKKDIPPDTGACVVWLTNRMAKRWKNKQIDNNQETPPQPIKVEIIAEDGRRPEKTS